MSQRNPMNDRYTSEGKKGQTRKSAAKAKPKTRAAASVHVERKEKTKQEKKAIKKAARNKDVALDREAYNVPTDEYKKLRRIWFGILGLGVVLLAASLFVQFQMPEMTTVSIVLIVLAYVAVIGAFIFDKVKINKLRDAYKEELRNTKSKEVRAQVKAEKAEQQAKAKEEPTEQLIEEVPTAGKKLSGLFKRSAKPQATEETTEESEK